MNDAQKNDGYTYIAITAVAAAGCESSSSSRDNCRVAAGKVRARRIEACDGYVRNLRGRIDEERSLK
jgi:hypothetical protein